MDQRKDRMHALWRSAYAHDEPMEIDCKSESGAIRFRLDLYNAVKQVRKGLEGDEGLREAVMNVMLSVKKEDRTKLIMAKKISSDLMVQVEALLKSRGDSIVSTETVEMEESFSRLQAKLAADEDPNLTVQPTVGKRTPFY